MEININNLVPLINSSFPEFIGQFSDTNDPFIALAFFMDFMINTISNDPNGDRSNDIVIFIDSMSNSKDKNVLAVLDDLFINLKEENKFCFEVLFKKLNTTTQEFASRSVKTWTDGNLSF